MCFATYRLTRTCNSITGHIHVSWLWTTSRMKIRLSSDLHWKQARKSVSFNVLFFFLVMSLRVLLSWQILYTGLSGFWWLRLKYKAKNPKPSSPLYYISFYSSMVEGYCWRYSSAFLPLDNKQKIILFYHGLERRILLGYWSMNSLTIWIFMNIHFEWTLYNTKSDGRIPLCTAYVYRLFRLAMNNTKK